MAWLFSLDNKNKVSSQSLDLFEFCNPASTKLLHLLIKIIPMLRKCRLVEGSFIKVISIRTKSFFLIKEDTVNLINAH